MTRSVHILTTVISLFMVSCATPPSGPQTIIHDQSAARMLKGDHAFSLQWISWDDFGKVSVTEESGQWRIVGRQDAKDNDDFISMDGVITEISSHEFKFEGTIITRIHHLADGEAVTRTGAKTFRMTRSRPYWRMVEMNNPQDSVVDYVDVYVRLPELSFEDQLEFVRFLGIRNHR